MRDLIVLIAILLIGLMIVGPSLMAGFGDLGERLGDWVKYGWEDVTDDGDEDNGIDDNGNGDENGNGDRSEGQIGMGITVQFKDGTQHSIKPEDLVFTLFPMTVYFEGREVEAIKWHFWMLVDWAGDLNSFTVDGYLQIEVPAERGTLKHVDVSEVYGSDMPRNEWFEVAEIAIIADHVEVLGDGDHVLMGYGSVEVQAVFPNTTDDRNARCESTLPISISLGTLTVFSFETQVQVLNP